MPYSLYNALHVSRQDMLNRLTNLDVVSNNLANMNTPGFKSNRSNFQELLDTANRNGQALINTQILQQQGSLAQSGRPLDWAIQGTGFFQVRLPNGTTAYTRDGQFQLDANRTIVSPSGYPLIWNGQIPVEMVDLSIRKDGTVEGIMQNGDRRVLGQVQLARFANPSALLGDGKNVYLVSDDSGQPQVGAPNAPNFGVVQAHAIEQSNVDIGEETTSMMTLQRSFQMAVRAFQQTDTMIGQAIHLRKG